VNQASTLPRHPSPPSELYRSPRLPPGGAHNSGRALQTRSLQCAALLHATYAALVVPVTASIAAAAAAASASAELQLKLMQVRVHTAPREGGESRSESAVRASWLRPESAVGSCPERRGAET
jgi:hypothetical protein